MTVYALHCTLCNKNYSRLSDWNEHLIKKLHQENGRIELSQWDKSARNCCVVIYSRGNLSKNVVQSVIPYFMENLGNGISVLVTDLLLSPERQGIGILRFENPEKLDQLFSIMKGSSIKINDQLYQFRRLGKFLQLEWEELLVSSFNIELPSLPPPTQLEDASLIPNHLIKPANCEDTQLNSEINCQVISILKQMEIPDEEFNFAKIFIKQVEFILRKKLNKQCRIGMFRNNYLKLRNHLSSPYLLFMFIPNHDGFTEIDEITMKQAFVEIVTSKNNQTVFPRLEVKTKLPISEDMAIDKLILSAPKVIFQCRNLGCEFQLMNFPSSIASLQLSKLVTYYCQFDPRVKPLLSLVYFWVEINGIQLSPDKICGRDVHSLEIDPVALEWLLLFFLFHKEKALPIPREILERPHQPVYYSDIDLGFNVDVKFTKNWENERKMGYPTLGSEEFGKHLLVVLTNFFKFCSENLKPGRHFINVRDGEILSSESFPKPFVLNGVEENKGNNSHGLGNHLNKKEKEYFSTLVKTKSSNIIILTNPFDLRWRLSIAHDNWFNVVYPKVKETAEKLDAFLGTCGSSNFTNDNIQSVLLCG